MSSIINGFIVFSLIITNVYFFGLINFIKDHEPNKCEMTYMFEYPQYVRISQEIDEKYPKYGLFAYSEGFLTKKSRDMYFDGIPVLFLPGNAGSHRQGRSLSSVALRKYLNSRTYYHFDYFTIDIGKEFSGLNGALLYQQLEYTNQSIYKILDLYKDRKNPPKSIILYAHSVGGIIARRLVENLEENSSLIPIVLTLSSPHTRPSLILDSYTYDFYKTLNSSKATNTTFVSLTGGYNDFLVPSFLTRLSYPDAINVATTQIPRSWLPTDHICIMWCKQIILAINRAIFDSVDPKTQQISTDRQFRKSIFEHHLINHNGLNPFLRNSYPNSKANIRNQGRWIEPMGRQYTIVVPSYSSSPYFYMIRLLSQPQHESLTIITINLKTIEWAFVCGAHIPQDSMRVCEEFTHLSHLTELSPSVLAKRRFLQVNLHDLIKLNPDWSHVVLRALPSDEEAHLNIDIYNSAERRLVVNLPHMLSLKEQIIIEKTPEKTIHYELELPNLYHKIQSYHLVVDSLQCKYYLIQTVASLIVPWGTQNQHKYFTELDEKPFNVRLYESRPQWASNQTAIIRLALDPNCRYKISIRSSIPGLLSHLARFYSPLLLVNIAAVILMTLNSQMRHLATNQDCSLFFVAIKEGAKPYYILTSVKLISRILSAKVFTNYLPAPDWLLMSQEGSDFFLLPLLLYVCSVGIVWFLGILFSISLMVFETTVHKLVLKFLAKTVSFNVRFSDYVMSSLHKLPFVVASFLVFLSFSTTGGLALCVGLIFYFMRLTQLSQDYIEELVWFYIRKIGQKFKGNKSKNSPAPSTSQNNEVQTSDKKDSSNNNNNNNNDIEVSAHNAIFFHTTIFFLWCIVTLINIPSVLTWAHNFKYSTKLHPDPAFYPGLILSFCALPLWQLDLPKIEKKGYVEVGQFISVLAVVSLIYAPISVFRLNYTIPTAIVVVLLHQLVAPDREITIETEESQPPKWFELIKSKLE